MDEDLKREISSSVDQPLKYECDCGIEIEINKKNNKIWAEALNEGEIPEDYPVNWISGFCINCGTPIREI